MPIKLVHKLLSLVLILHYFSYFTAQVSFGVVFDINPHLSLVGLLLIRQSINFHIQVFVHFPQLNSVLFSQVFWDRNLVNFATIDYLKVLVPNYLLGHISACLLLTVLLTKKDGSFFCTLHVPTSLMRLYILQIEGFKIVLELFSTSFGAFQPRVRQYLVDVVAFRWVLVKHAD
jgi:hypothetical protein